MTTKLSNQSLLFFLNRGFPWTASENSNFQILKKVKNLGKTAVHYQKAGYGPVKTNFAETSTFLVRSTVQILQVNGAYLCVLCWLLGSKTGFFHLDWIQTRVATSAADDPDPVTLSGFLNRIFLQSFEADRSSASCVALSANFKQLED